LRHKNGKQENETQRINHLCGLRIPNAGHDDDDNRRCRVLIFHVPEIRKLTDYIPVFAYVKAGFFYTMY